VYTPVEWEYRPVKMLAREGQQREFTTKEFVNTTP
jgi:hypothetical protein